MMNFFLSRPFTAAANMHEVRGADGCCPRKCKLNLLGISTALTGDGCSLKCACSPTPQWAAAA